MLIDVNKPIQLHNHNDNSVRPARVVSSWSHGIIIAHMLSTNYPGYWNVDFDGSIPERAGSPWRVENVPPELRAFTRTIVIYDYKGSDCSGSFVDATAARDFFKNNPGTIIAMKEVTVKEGEGIHIVT